jgi:hypothetical protein
MINANDGKKDPRGEFNGAFTGGFSAGFFNSVGSVEGWVPQTFTSSRSTRADKKQASVVLIKCSSNNPMRVLNAPRLPASKTP